MKKESREVYRKLTPTVKRELLKYWLARLRIRPLKPLSYDRIKEILDKEISKVHREQIKQFVTQPGLAPGGQSNFFLDLFKRIEYVTKKFILDIQFEIDLKEKMPPRVLRKCRRAFISHHASFKRIAERFPFVMDIGEIDRSYSKITLILEDVIADVGRQQTLNKPLTRWIYELANVYHEWTGGFAPSTRALSLRKDPAMDKTPFSQFVSHCVKSLGLDEIWPEDALQEVIDEVIQKLPKYAAKRII